MKVRFFFFLLLIRTVIVVMGVASSPITGNVCRVATFLKPSEGIYGHNCEWTGNYKHGLVSCWQRDDIRRYNELGKISRNLIWTKPSTVIYMSKWLFFWFPRRQSVASFQFAIKVLKSCGQTEFGMNICFWSKQNVHIDVQIQCPDIKIRSIPGWVA